MPQYPIAFLAQNKAKNGTGVANGAVGSQSDLWVSPRHAEYYTAAFNGFEGVAANPIATPVTTSAALATTYVGLCLSNPAGSGRNLILLDVEAQILVATSAPLVIGLATGYAAGGITVHTTSLTVQPALIGTTSTLVGLADSACTLVGTPLASVYLGTLPTTITGSIGKDLKGAIVVPPGGWAAIVTSTAGPTAGFLGSIAWEEANLV